MQTEASVVKQDPKRRALGKGLESLLPSRPAAPLPTIQAKAEEPVAAVEVQSGRPLEIELTLIERNPFQTRSHFDPQKLKELAQSIEASGVVQPVVVRESGNGRYQLITGERRWLASFEAGKTHIPAIVRQVSDEHAMEMTIVENLQRADLNPMEQARAYLRLSTDFHMTQEAMATRTGMSRAAVTNFLRLLRLPDSVKRHVEAGELSFGHAKILLGLDPEAIEAAAKKVMALSMSVRQTETYVQGLLNPESKVKEEKPEPAVDPNVRDIQTKLQSALGLRVKIEDKNGKGRVIIEYTRLDDFDDILDGLRAR